MVKTVKCIRILVLASLSLLLVACGGGGTNPISSFVPTRYWVGYLLWNDSSNKEELRKSRSNGKEDQLISQPGLADSMLPTFSDDGNKIAYYKQTNASTIGVFVMDALSGNSTQIAQFNGDQNTTVTAISWSRDNIKLLFANAVGKMFSVNADGTNLVQLTPSTIGTWDRDGSFSPDGSRVVFERSFNLWACNSDGSNQILIADSSSYDYKSPNWSRDGSRIVCVRDVNTLMLFNPDGTGEMVLPVLGDTTVIYLPRWSPDGTMISFSASTLEPGRPRYAIVEASTGKVFWRGKGFSNIGWINQL